MILLTLYSILIPSTFQHRLRLRSASTLNTEHSQYSQHPYRDQNHRRRPDNTNFFDQPQSSETLAESRTGSSPKRRFQKPSTYQSATTAAGKTRCETRLSSAAEVNSQTPEAQQCLTLKPYKPSTPTKLSLQTP